MLDRKLRADVERGLTPLGKALGRFGVTPDALTVFGLLCAIGTAFAVGSGMLWWGVAGIALSGLGDLLDGNMARSSGRSGPRGEFFDSVADRASDAIVLGGVGWYVARDSAYLPTLAMAVAGVSMLISYERAKAESLGINARGGLMERAERYLILGIGMAFDVLVPVLWLMLGLCAVTAIHRFSKVWIAAGRPVMPDDDTQSPTRKVTMRGPDAAKLRDWWESHGPSARSRAHKGPTTERQHPMRRRART